MSRILSDWLNPPDSDEGFNIDIQWRWPENSSFFCSCPTCIRFCLKVFFCISVYFILTMSSIAVIHSVFYSQLQEYEGKETAMLVDRYRFMDLYPCTMDELRALGYKVTS